MLRRQRCLAILICLSSLAYTISSYGEEEIEDLIDIAESKSKIIAIIEGRKKISTTLRGNERVLWSDTKGYLGAFLTNLRFFVISISSDAWQVLRLRIDESERGVASLSPYIALLVTRDRAIGFDAVSNRFIETHLPTQDELLEVKAEEYVAVVVTSSRALGLATEATAFTEISFRLGETLEGIKITASKATVQTSDRLLIFESIGSKWNEHRLD